MCRVFKKSSKFIRNVQLILREIFFLILCTCIYLLFQKPCSRRYYQVDVITTFNYYQYQCRYSLNRQTPFHACILCLSFSICNSSKNYFLLLFLFKISYHLEIAIMITMLSLLYPLLQKYNKYISKSRIGMIHTLLCRKGTQYKLRHLTQLYPYKYLIYMRFVIIHVFLRNQLIPPIR